MRPASVTGGAQWPLVVAGTSSLLSEQTSRNTLKESSKPPAFLFTKPRSTKNILSQA